MLNAGDIVKVISTTEHIGERKELIPIGTMCFVSIAGYFEGEGNAVGIIPIDYHTSDMYWYLENEVEKVTCASEIEKEHPECVNENISTEGKYVNVENLVRAFEDMANRGSLLARGNVSQQDLLMQIIGTIVHVSMEDIHMNNDLNRKEINQ